MGMEYASMELVNVSKHGQDLIAQLKHALMIAMVMASVSMENASVMWDMKD
jgi:hypothetical protein